MRINSTKGYITFITMLGLLPACGPRMQTVTDYMPPVTDSGMRCVARANQDRAACDSGNRIAMEQCTERAAVDADQAFNHAKNTYTKQLESYIRANEHYDHEYEHYLNQKNLLIRDGELDYIRCSDDVKMENVNQFPKCKKFLKKANKRADKLRQPRSPIKPYPPNRNAIFNRFRSSCNNADSNCELAFNQSYRSCGGTVSTRQVCVSNCK